MTQNYNYWLLCKIIVWFLLRTSAVAVVSARDWYGFIVRLLCRPCAVTSASLCGNSSLSLVASTSAIGCFRLLASSAHGCFGVSVRFASTSAWGCFRGWFVRWPRVVASAFACGCFGVRVRLLRYQRTVALTPRTVAPASARRMKLFSVTYTHSVISCV